LGGEQYSGDACAVSAAPHRTMVLAVDGLGHGIGANEAAEEALRIFNSAVEHRPAEIVHRIHDALRKTRGAAAGVAEIDQDSSLVRFCGVGNIIGAITSGNTK